MAVVGSRDMLKIREYPFENRNALLLVLYVIYIDRACRMAYA